jgi:hypothetical protein
VTSEIMLDHNQGSFVRVERKGEKVILEYLGKRSISIIDVQKGIRVFRSYQELLQMLKQREYDLE